MQIDYRYLRKEKEKAVRSLHEKDFPCREGLQATHYENATVLPIIKMEEDDGALLFGRGCCVDQNGHYIEASGIPGRVGGYYAHETPELCDETVVFCGFLAAGWGHFLVESVCRLWYALQNDSDVDHYVFVNGENGGCEIRGNFLEFLRLLGIADKCVMIDRPRRYTHLILPEIAYRSGAFYSREYGQIFDTVIQNALLESGEKQEYPERVFLSRAHIYDKKHFYGRRRCRERGLDMLDDYFARNGYTILYPERTPLKEQLLHLSHARIIASESGSCAHNMLLAPTGAHTLIMERQSLPNRFQADIDRIRDLHTVYVDSYYALYPTADFGGPYLLMYTEYMKRFSEDSSYSAPDKRYRSPSYEKASVRWFIRLYRHLWGQQLWWGDEIDSVTDWSEVFKEANNESYEHFRPFLEGPLQKLAWKLRERIGY